MDDALIRTSAEMQVRIAQLLDKRSVYQCIDIWKNPAHTLVGKYVFISESGLAPYILAGFLLYASGKLCEGFNLI